MSYHRFIDETGEFYGSFEVFYIDECPDGLPGWYWQACFPGCLPDGEECGPFETYEEAIKDARGEQ